MKLSTILLLSGVISQPQIVTQEELKRKEIRSLEHGICMLLEGEIIHPSHYLKYEHVAKSIIEQIEERGSLLRDNTLTPYVHDGKLDVLCTIYSYTKEEFEPHL